MDYEYYDDNPERTEAEYQDSARHDRFEGFDRGDLDNPNAYNYDE
jgi:hypothetical protein